MLKKLFKSIKYFLFGNLTKENTTSSNYNNSYSDVIYTPATKIKKQLNTNKSINNNVSKKLVKNNHLTINNLKKEPLINKKNLNKKIKINIFFIDNLMAKMDSLNEYLTYYEKLNDLKNQSKNSLKIIYHINENAIYYNNTMKAIIKHTNVIAELLEV